MSDATDLADAFSWSISKLARCFDMDRKTVLKRISQSGIQPAGQFRGSPIYLVKDVSRAIHAPSGASGTVKDWDEFPEARKAWWQSELYRLQYEEKMGQLIPDSEFAKILATVVKILTSGVDSIPDLLERDAGLAPDMVAVVLEVLDGMRSRLASELADALRLVVDNSDDS